jgi:predicted nucleotidyltransferase
MKQLVQFNEIFGNKNVMKILLIFLDNPSLEINQSNIIKKVKIAKATAVKWLKILFEKAFLNVKSIGTTNIYTLNNDYYIVKQIKILYNLYLLDSFSVNAETYLYGSCARGENIADSDIDILIMNKRREDIVEIIEKFSKKIKKNINYVVFSDLEWSKMEKNDKAFFERVEKDKIKIK